MTILGFSSDIHLDHLNYHQIVQYCNLINSSSIDSLVLTGDISTSSKLITHLTILSENIKIPVYFTIGNHDLWGSSIQYVLNSLATFKFQNIVFLDQSPVVQLSSTTALIGSMGFYDGLNGDIEHSRLFPTGMPEFRFVTDFLHLSPSDKKSKLITIVQNCANFIESQLMSALAENQTVYLGTHVPPYRESSRHNGAISDNEGAPFFSNRIIGERLIQIMSKYPTKRLIILCGHSHSEAYYQPISNIECFTASAEYGFPSLYKTFEIL